MRQARKLFSTLPKRVRQTFRRRPPAARAIPPDFDPDFYARLYPDVRDLAGPGAWFTHYERHGRQEGRFPNPAAYMADLTATFGPLPDDFAPATYRWLHPELSAILVEDWEISAHYLKHGRAERRAYRAGTDDLSAAFRDLLNAEARLADPDALPAAPEDAFERFLRAHGLDRGPWLTRFNLAQFHQLNADWIGTPPASTAAGIRLFVESGIDRLAPLGGDLAFDPAFYRATYPVDPDLCDADLYRDWLAAGCRRGRAPNEAAAVFEAIGARAFPACFDADAYRRAVPKALHLDKPGRIHALEHWRDIGFAAGIRAGVAGPGVADLYAALALRMLHQSHFRLAREAFDEALRLGGATAARLHGRGDALRALGEAAATADFRAAAALPEAGVWSHIHAADGLFEAGDLAGALAQVRASSPLFVRSAQWRAAAAGILRRAFEARCEAARAAYRVGERAQADAIMAGALRSFVEDWPLAEPLPAPLPPADRSTLVMLANVDLPQCVHYRVEQRRRQLEHGGWSVRVFGQGEVEGFRQALPGAGAAIFYRVPAFPDIAAAILAARALGLPTFYDIDDLIFDPSAYPDPFASFEGQISRDEYVGLEFGVPLFRFAMSLCDEGMASTPALAEAVGPLVRREVCHVVRNALDQRNDRFLARPLPEAGAPEGPVTIFYGSGTKAHNQDFSELAGPALVATLRRHPAARLVIAGHLTLGPAFAPFEDRIRRLGFTADVGEYWEILSGVDINLAVLLPGPVADAKSEIKWLEAATCGVPSVVSRTRTYREILADGEDVLLADTPEEWAGALERLVADPALRRRIGAAARRKALAAYTLDAAAATLAAFLPPPDGLAPADAPPGVLAPGVLPPAARASGREASPGLPAARRPGKPRLLIVNVFFPPQTIGGATRVVRDNLDTLIALAGGRYDVAVVASDDGAQPVGRVRVDAYGDVPVLRIATPMERDMDWRPFNPEIGEIFGTLLDRLRPDLIHFHCVQRLTASTVEAARARRIPYFVTLHDGWWISDHQFLIDRSGRPVRPGTDWLASEPDPVRGQATAIVRRRRLGQALRGAEALLAVSETFAQVYREAGFPATRAVPNGLPALAPVPRRPAATHRVRLGHVGGREAHKGAPLIEAVLRTTSFENLSFTLVDLAVERGYAHAETWGTTPVRIVGPVPQGEVASLYADLDVLLVPSLWPESFGLVAREARALGLWVVASDRGAIGEDIEPGVDGFVVDVANPDGLRAALQAIDRDPARYRERPASTRPIRTAAEQGADLLRLYEARLGPGGAPALARAAE
ncbi:D-inositol-3-phosphate glycosyltransferase [Methylobacterium crusticola]|uniref:D-inositol-3-phosphate glycosyltransferase n=1 Tax=Methylobacterium crusticola TaxID=1697972 RepID=A0ABQ4QRL2_9HYPH|nr:glycosyltransferase [Methylobacterium crusticola]GJD47440.1 D-inositol-3-phosphate glycosyltransferase [Methylobacterium crusticola]